MNYHLLMLENHTLFTKKFFERIKNLQLSFGQPKILEYLLNNERCMQKDIALACFIEPASVTSVFIKMEKDGLIFKKNLNGNRRSYYVYLTDIGKEKAKEIQHHFKEMEEEVFKGLSEKEIMELYTLLGKVNKNLWNM